MTFKTFSKNRTSILSKQALIICFSNAIAYFDFLIYLYLADIIFASFFPATTNSMVAQLQTVSLFSVGYLARPLGALIIGRYGDIHGRKAALLISLSGITITTLITACLPTYVQIGILAPILFVIVRIIQGMAFGCYAPLGWVFIAEHVPKRNLATYCSLVTASFVLGIMITDIFFNIFTNSYTHNELVNSAWRIPFIIGAVFSFITLITWYFLDETPMFEQFKETQTDVPRFFDMGPIFKRLNALFLTSLLTFIISSAFIVVALLLPQLILLKFSIDETMLNSSNELGLFFLMLGCIFYGLLADNITTGKALLVGSLAFIIQILAFYYYLSNSEASYILIMYALLGFCTGFIGLIATIIVQLFTIDVRLTAVSITYNLIYAIVGSMLPIGLLYSTNKISFSPALYLTFVGLISFILGLYIYRAPRFRNLEKI